MWIEIKKDAMLIVLTDPRSVVRELGVRCFRLGNMLRPTVLVTNDERQELSSNISNLFEGFFFTEHAKTYHWDRVNNNEKKRTHRILRNVHGKTEH